MPSVQMATAFTTSMKVRARLSFFCMALAPAPVGYSNFKGNYRHLVAAGYRCIIPDHIGYGFSDKPADVDHPLSFFVECIKQTLDAAGVDNLYRGGELTGGRCRAGPGSRLPRSGGETGAHGSRRPQ